MVVCEENPRLGASAESASFISKFYGVYRSLRNSQTGLAGQEKEANFTIEAQRVQRLTGGQPRSPRLVSDFWLTAA
jgi:hypothetical protein